jgi:GxxExxY protein
MAETDGFQHEAHEGHKAHEETKRRAERLAAIVVDAGLTVHRALGPGLLESIYEQCLAHELGTRGIPVRRQLALPVHYKDVRLEAGYRIDLMVDDLVVIEVKAVETLTRLHESQILTYLRLSGVKLGFIFNFNVSLFKDGLRRFAL